MGQNNKGSFELYPWVGGYNPSDDPIVLNPQQLQIAENIYFDTDGGRKKRGGIDYLNTAAISVGGSPADLIWGTDYWANVSNTKRAYHVVITSGGKAFRSPYNGIYSAFNSTSTSVLPVSPGLISSEVFNEDLIIGYAKNAVPKVWDNQNTAVNLVSATAATGTYPSGWILRSHRNRLWIAGNSTNPDRISYSGFTAGAPDHRAWNFGSSAGFIDVQPGDGDPVGITAIFPEVNQGGLYVAKKTKIYFINTSDPSDANWTISLVSNGIGCVSHNAAIAVDQTDVLFPSNRGIHSLGQVISQAGIIEAAFLSKEIQTDYQDILSTADRSKMSAVWYPSLNSYYFNASSTADTFDYIYAYNVPLKQWYVWKAASGSVNNFNFMHSRYNGNTNLIEFISLSDGGWVLLMDQQRGYDISGASLMQVPINYRIKSAFLFPGKQRTVESHFTDLAFYVSSTNDSSFTVYWSIDNNPPQSTSIEQVIIGGNILGTTLLGADYILGESRGIKPYLISISGVGNGIEFEIQHHAPEDFQLYGIACKFIQSNESYDSGRNFGR